MVKRGVNSFLLLILLFSCKTGDVLELGKFEIEKKKLLYKDNFEGDLSKWVVEKESIGTSEVYVKEGKMVVDVGGGATIWFKNKIEKENILIEYRRTVIMRGGANDRLSDLNQFWMAEDPENLNLFTRSGSFGEYDSVRMYYAGIGGNRNTTTRFRKYPGNGQRKLIHNLIEERYLLLPNKTYLIQIVVLNGVTKVFVDGKEYFSYEDKNPLTEGYFGFRTVQSHQEIYDFKVFSIIPN
jgi:rhamnogalacturonan endolyase